MSKSFVLLAGLAFVASTTHAGNIVAYGPSISSEGTYAENAGHTVTIWDDATWQTATANDFAAFDAILVGQNECGNFGTPTGMWTNSALWGPLVTGNVLMHSHDDHFGEEVPEGSQDNRYDLVIARCADWTTSGSGLGLCISIQCADILEAPEGPGSPNLNLPGIGLFEIERSSGDDIDIVNPSHPAMAGITDADLDCWGSSVHTHILQFPADFEVLATDTGLGCEETVTEGEGDGSGPVTIARGGVGSSILAIPSLSPAGLALLAVALAGGAIALLRRR
ncbi:MAG: IPTL-CTERM sorting domain-containing protein [Thermoanaerobaculia bacterium]